MERGKTDDDRGSLFVGESGTNYVIGGRPETLYIWKDTSKNGLLDSDVCRGNRKGILYWGETVM